MTDNKKSETPKARPKTVEISVEDLKGIAGGIAAGPIQPPKPKGPKGVQGDVQEGTGI